jgi:hypothetical protein
MSLPTKSPVPQPALSWLTAQGRQDFAQYLAKLDALVAALALDQPKLDALVAALVTAPSFQNVGPLVNAANDGAAATAGVKVNQIYRNGSVVQIRVT